MKTNGAVKIVLMVAALASALGGGFWLGVHRHTDEEVAAVSGEGAGEEQQQYTCGMHPFIVRDEPGNCPICGMKLVPKRAGAGAGAQTAERKIKFWRSPMDPTYVRDTPGKDNMGHDMVPVYEDGGAMGEISIDPVTVQNMGIRTAPVEIRDMSRTVRAVGLVTYAESRQYSINSKIDGWIEQLHVNQTGQFVKKGQPLLEIYSPELVTAQQEYLLALQNRDRMGSSSFADAAEGSRRLLEASRSRLRYWDISDRQIAELESSRQIRKTLTLYSPNNGVVTMKQALAGMRVMAGEELLQLADLSRVWVNADIYEFELPWVQTGLKVKVEVPSAPDLQLTGTIAYLYPYLQNETRTVRARIELDNPGFLLKPDMYANVIIEARPTPGALTVPGNAVLNSGKGQTVFVALGEGRFAPRLVKTGVSDDEGRVQILSGLKEGENVVTSAQFMLDSESKLREAIQKMLDAKGDSAPATPGLKEHGQGTTDNEDLFK